MFTTITDAINWIAGALNLDTEGAQWVYENTGCPDWDDPALLKYDFLAEIETLNIPARLVS